MTRLIANNFPIHRFMRDFTLDSPNGLGQNADRFIA